MSEFGKFSARVSACAGKKVPSILEKHLKELERCEKILSAQPKNEFASARIVTLVGYLNDEVTALESKEVKNSKSVKVGEIWLSDDQLARKANRHAGLVQEISRQQAELTRRLAELTAAKNRVADSIPMSQREEFTALVNLFGQSVITTIESE